MSHWSSASLARNIPDLLRLVLGFQVAHATGAQYTETRHGVSDQLERRLEVLLNGNSVYQATNASVEWNLIGGRLGPMDAVATFQYTEDDGFENIDDHKRINNLRLHGNLALSSYDTLDLEIGYSEGEVGADGVSTEVEPFRDRRLRESYQSVAWRNTRADGGGHRLAFTHRGTTQDDSNLYFITPSVFLPLGFYDSGAERFDLEI